MKKFNIIVKRMYETSINVEADNLDEAYELMSGGAFENIIDKQELEQSNIVDNYLYDIVEL